MLQPIGRDAKSDSNDAFTRQGSIRRVLPSGHNKEDLFGRQNDDLNKYYKQFHQEYIILAEYQMVQSENIGGVYVIPSHESSFVWFGVIFVRSGPYEDAVFRFTLHLDENFPNCGHPKVIFQSEVFHPVIEAKTKELHLHGAFPTWQKVDQHIWQVLKYVKWIFSHVEASTAHAINAECVNLMSNRVEFECKCKESVKLSRSKLYEPPLCDDKHYIVFEQYTPHTHDQIRENILHSIHHERLTPSGHSWVKEGTFRPLTKQQQPNDDKET